MPLSVYPFNVPFMSIFDQTAHYLQYVDEFLIDLFATFKTHFLVMADIQDS